MEFDLVLGPDDPVAEPLRILLAADPGSSPYVQELVASLKNERLTVEVGTRAFWLGEGHYDIVHIQWPEALLHWRRRFWSDVRILLESVLPGWRAAAKIVITRHNERPHDHADEIALSLYEHIYGFADGVIHFGEHGLEPFRDRHAEKVLCHAVIPHPVWASYGQQREQLAARRKLGLPLGKPIVLVFGAIRHEEERRLVSAAFEYSGTPGRLLLAPTLGHSERPSRSRFAQWLRWEVIHREVLPPRRIYLGQNPVPADLVPEYFSAADVVFIPRCDTLNSGVLPLAFQYGRVAVGPRVGNVGRWLEETGNPTFDPLDEKSAGRALDAAFAAARGNLGEANRRFAATNWRSEQVARAHALFYETVLRTPRPPGHESETNTEPPDKLHGRKNG